MALKTGWSVRSMAEFERKSAIDSTRRPIGHGVQQMAEIGTVTALFEKSCFWATFWEGR